jgi:tRNA A-37 threonylcarbamoyl transferase component Bud32
MKPAPGAAGHRLVKEEPGTLIWSEPLASGGRAVVKMYRRRPPHEPLRRLFVPYRVEREYRILESLSRQGVACPEPLSWSHGRDRANGRHERLATREIADAVPLDQLLGREGRAPPDLAPLFALGRRMHECGVAHGAFYPRNVLVTAADGPQPTFHLIDFAHGRAFRGNIVGTRPARYDLLDMLQTIASLAPPDGAPRWLAAYGLGAGEAAALLARLPRHRIERPWRHFRRMAVDAIALRDALGLGA